MTVQQTPKVKHTFDFKPTIKIVEVPQLVLTSADCEERWRRLPAVETEPFQRSMQFKVPDGLEPGSLLSIPVGADEENVVVNVPESAAGGDTLCMSQRADGSWKVVKKTKEFCFTLFGYSHGDTLKMIVPDGRVLSFTIPNGMALNQLVVVTDSEKGWAFTRQEDLPTLAQMPKEDPAIVGPYLELLRLVEKTCHLRKLPTDTAGSIRVSMPFCGRLSEHNVLCKFIDDRCLSLPGIVGAELCGAEVGDHFYFDWAIAQSHCSQVYPRIKMNMSVHDLAVEPLQEAALTIGIHPEVTKGGPWFPIIGSILRSAEKGICVLATFYPSERDTLLNMIEMHKADGISVEVFENPYYRNNENPAIPAMRFIFIIARDVMRKVKKVKQGV